MRRGGLAQSPVPENEGTTIVESRSPVPRPLPEGYYVENFQLLLDTVQDRYDDLLHPEERAFRQDFVGFSEDARRLFVRLISRKGPCFRRDRLDYREIDLDRAVAELEEASFLDRASELEAADLLQLMLRPELAELSRELTPETFRSTARRDELLLGLEESVPGEILVAEVRRRLDILRPLRLEHVLLYRLLFFGNLYQDMSEFVIRDLGVMRYEDYSLSRELRRFPDRQALDDVLQLRLLRQQTAVHLYQGEVQEALTLAHHVRDRLDQWHPQGRRHADRVLVRVARQLERESGLDQALDLALELYEKAERPPARERRARVLDRLGRIREACELCDAMVAEPRDETERIFAPRFAHRLRRSLGEEKAPWPRTRRPEVELTLEPDPSLQVEALVLKDLARQGRRAFFSENWLWKSLFGLAFWDIVFAPVAGAFQHPFQLGPLDLHTPDFRAARSEAVADRLEELRSLEDLTARLHEVYRRKEGVANSLVSWHEGSWEQIELALGRVRGVHLAQICDRLSRDLRRYRRGLPDLFVVRDEDPGFELWEIKGPGDQLRPEQKGWIDFLNSNQLPARVVKVRW